VAIPGGPQDVASILDKALAAAPDAEALIGRHSRYTYRQLDAAINAATAALRSFGIGPGDRVAASAVNQPELVIAFLASQRLGAIWVGIARLLAPPEKILLLEESGAAVLLADAATRGAMDSVLASKLPRLKIVEIEPDCPETGWSALLKANNGA